MKFIHDIYLFFFYFELAVVVMFDLVK